MHSSPPLSSPPLPSPLLSSPLSSPPLLFSSLFSLSLSHFFRTQPSFLMLETASVQIQPLIDRVWEGKRKTKEFMNSF
jgi:hypothetical protein